MFRLSAIIIFAVSMLSIAPSANAVNLSYPGANCTKVTSNSSFAGTLAIDNNGKAWNTSTTSWLKLICPLAFDRDLPDFKAQIYVVDQSSSNISCTASLTNTGEVKSSAAVTSSGSSSSSVELLISGPSNYNYFHTSRYIICDIPPQSSGKNSGVVLYQGFHTNE